LIGGQVAVNARLVQIQATDVSGHANASSNPATASIIASPLDLTTLFRKIVADPNPKPPLSACTRFAIDRILWQALRPRLDEAAQRQSLALQPSGKKHHMQGTNSLNVKAKKT
jgi:hypothetical protein